MNRFHSFLVAVIAICIPLSAFAQTSANHNKKLVNRIVETLAISQKIMRQPNDLRQVFKRNPFRLQEKVNKQWLKAFNEAYSKEKLMQYYKNGLSNKLDSLSADQLNAWLKRSSTQKLANARQTFYSLQGKRKRIIALYELEQDPPSKEKQKLIAAYAEAVTPNDALVESTIAIMKPTITAVGQISSRIKFSDQQINMIVTNMRKQGPTRMSQLKEQVMPVKFHNVPSKAIQQSLSFWQSKTGQQLAQAIYESMQKAYQKAGQQLAKAVSNSNHSLSK